MSPHEFRLLADLLPDPMLLLSGEGTVLAANGGFSQRVGVALEAIVGKPITHFVENPSDDVASYLTTCGRSRERLPSSLHWCVEGRVVPWRCEGAVVDPSPDPHRRTILLRLMPQATAVQQFRALNERIAMLAKEIERRRLAEEELASQRERLQITLNSIGDAVIATDAEGRVTMLNPVARQLTGWGEEAIGRPLSEVFTIVSEITGEAAANPVDTVLREGMVVGLANHTALISRDGTRRPISDSAAPIWDSTGSLTGVVLVFRDASEQRRSERALRRSEARLRLALEAGGMGTWEWNTRTNEVHWSAALEALHGLTPGTFPGTFEAYQHDIHPDDRERVLASISGAMERGVDHQIEYRIIWPDGTLHWVEARGRLVRDEATDSLQMIGVCMDVTARKRAEEQLREQSRITETLYRLSGTLLAELDLDRLVQTITDEATSLVGAEVGALFRNVASEEGESYVLYSLSGVPREQFADFPTPRVTAIFEPTFRGQGVVRLDDVTRDARYGKNAPHQGLPTGHLPIRSYLAAPIISRSGDVLGGLFFGHSRVGVFSERDEQLVTGLAAHAAIALDNAQLYRATQDSELRFRQLADSMPQIVWAARPDGYVDYYNQRWYESQDQPEQPEQLAGGDESWLPILHPDDRQRTLERWYEAVGTGQPYEIEYRFRDPQRGGYRWYLGRALPVRDESSKVIRWFGTSTDIEDQKRAEQASRFLADASAELSRLMDYQSTLKKVASLAVPDFADWCAVDLVESDGALRRLAITHSDPRKVEIASELMRRYPPADDAPIGAARVVRTGEVELRPDVPDSLIQQFARDDEHLRLLRELGVGSYMCVPLVIQQRIFGVLTFAFSESGRSYRPDDLKMAQDLAHRAAIAIDNARLYAELKERDERKNEFLAMLGHELRNPLAPIRGGLDLLMLEGESSETLELMREQVEHLVRLVDDLLDVSRIVRGKIQLRKEPLEVSAFMRRAVDSSQAAMADHDHQLHVTLPSEPVWIEADPVRLAQVVTNLLNNAAKYTDRGGQIWFSADRIGNEVEIRVRDNGMGIDADLLPKIFDLFTQADRTLDRSQGGLGIGLTLVRTLVELHAGTIRARSAGTARGSEFTIQLPVIASAAGANMEQATASSLAGSYRVLIVDDNHASAKILGRLIEKLGDHQIAMAHDGPSALEAARRHQPQIIFLDIGLPRLDGYDVARTLREEGFHETLLIAMTGYGQEEDRRRSQAAGFDVHLVKPPDIRLIQPLLSHQKLRR